MRLGARVTKAMELDEALRRRYELERWLGSAGEPLERAVRARYERRLGVDLSHVRVFTGERAAAMARARDANALTIGATGMVVLGDAVDRDPSSNAGEALLAHELVHVAQAMRNGDQMPFVHDDEVEARRVEDEVLADITAGTALASARFGEAGPADPVAAIRARVLELIDEADRASVLRG
jgi:hypothetical protein